MPGWLYSGSNYVREDIHDPFLDCTAFREKGSFRCLCIPAPETDSKGKRKDQGREVR